jgi:hypothetical protein
LDACFYHINVPAWGIESNQWSTVITPTGTICFIIAERTSDTCVLENEAHRYCLPCFRYLMKKRNGLKWPSVVR